MVKFLSPSAGAEGPSLIEEMRSHVPHGQKQNVKQEQYCDKFRKSNSLHKKLSLKKVDQWLPGQGGTVMGVAFL